MNDRAPGRSALDENMTDSQNTGRHRKVVSQLRHLAGQDAARPLPRPRPGRRTRGRTRLLRIAVAAAIITVAAVGLVIRLSGGSGGPAAAASAGSYLGIYEPGEPQSYAGVSAFAAATGVRPKVVAYYSGWMERFQAGFAATVNSHGAVPLVQIDPTGISLASIASGRYDAYLRSFAASVRAFGHRVILSFGHEMNGDWYSWARRHASPAVFVAAWRHIVTVFRRRGAGNVTWMWTVNVMDKHERIPSPARWWPGSSYVDWVGMDGYYLKPSLTFASLFGPTIKAVRALTLDPILISETSVAPAAGQPAKIADLFTGIRAYGLLGFVWFNVNVAGPHDWRLSGPAAFAAFRRGADALARRVS